MNKQTLLRLGAGAAIFGGAMRVVSAFIPYTPQLPGLEALYAAIDLSLLFGLLSIYARAAEAIGWLGLGGFVIALGGLASIVGPDTTMFGIDWYQTGAAAAAIGMAMLGGALILTRRQITAAMCWLAIPAFALAAAPPLSAQGAGIVFGLGFVAAGLTGLNPPAAERG